MPKRHNPSSFGGGSINLMAMSSLSRLLHPRMMHYIAIEAELYSKQNKKRKGYEEASRLLKEEIQKQLPNEPPPPISMRSVGIRLSLLLTRSEAEKDVDNIAKWVIDEFTKAVKDKYEINFDDSQIEELVILKDRDIAYAAGSRVGAPPEIDSIIGIAIGNPRGMWQMKALVQQGIKPTAKPVDICSYMNSISKNTLINARYKEDFI